MSLHTVNPEKKSIDALIKEVHKYYPRLAENRTNHHGQETGVYIQITEYINGRGLYEFNISMMDGYYDDAWFSASGESLSETLEKFIEIIQTEMNSDNDIDIFSDL